LVLRFSPTTRTEIGTLKKERKLDGFSDENPNPILRVLNNFGSLASVVLLLTWGCYSSPLATTFSFYFYYSSSIVVVLSLLLLFFSLLVLLFSHGVALIL
jgi:hypothetical protein